MGVKVMERLPVAEINARMEQLKGDVREIIEKRIRFSEITDPPYNQNTVKERLRTAFRRVYWEEIQARGIQHPPRVGEIFGVQSRKIDNVVHWYVVFDPEKWDEVMKGEGDA